MVRESLLHLFGSSPLHRSDDHFVSRATADVAFQSMSNFALGWLGVFSKESSASHQHPRRAVAALQTVFLSESLLDGTETIERASQSLYRADILSVGLHCKQGAALDGLSIE